MKKVFIVLGLILSVVVLIACFKPKSNQLQTSAYIRIHIRANSNNDIDQQIKYKVKTEVVEYLTPYLSECKTVHDAHIMLAGKLGDIENVANSVLIKSGFNYKSHARLNDEYFPTRAYNEIVLNEGVYDSLILELGEGVGNNWWCVVYPPLCFIGAEGNGTNTITYKSKIFEIINKYCK